MLFAAHCVLEDHAHWSVSYQAASLDEAAKTLRKKFSNIKSATIFPIPDLGSEPIMYMPCPMHFSISETRATLQMGPTPYPHF